MSEQMPTEDIPITRTYPATRTCSVAQTQVPRFLRSDVAQTLSGGDIAATRALVQPALAGVLTGIATVLGTYDATELPVVSIAVGVAAGAVFGLTTFIYTCENKPNYR